LTDIVRFNHQAKQFLTSPDPSLSLEQFIQQGRYGEWLRPCYLKPMAAAIWSTPSGEVGHIPAEFILRFYQHHGLLNTINHPDWYVIDGGSNRYVEKLIQPFSDAIRLNTPVLRIERDDKVNVITQQGSKTFDAVVMACHSDQALTLLAKPTPDEIDILQAIPYSTNHVTLHTDNNSLPTQKAAWASWNYRRHMETSSSLTYYMNRLQSIHAPENFYVSVNQTDIDPNTIIDTFQYTHPLYNERSVRAKANHHRINNKHSTFYVGAYWGNGFHEDGIVSSQTSLNTLVDIHE